MASALTNSWGVAGSCHPALEKNSLDDCIRVLAWNCNVFKGKQLLLGEKIASTGWKSTKAAPKMSIHAVYLPQKTKWWEKDIKANMKDIQSEQNLVGQLLTAGDKLTVVHFYSPSCGACRALHPKVCQLASMNPEVQFLTVNYDGHKEMCHRLHVHVLPLFRFYRGRQGRVCSFSCSISTIRKLKDALIKHGAQRESLGAAKGLEASELLSLAPSIDIPIATIG